MQKISPYLSLIAFSILFGCQQSSPSENSRESESKKGIDRTILPIHEPDYAPITEMDARNATAPPRFEVKAPEKAPNVVIILIDDQGFGTASSFGGPVEEPTSDRLASSGLRYNKFHTTALCSPTRTAILTGRNHHQNNAGAIMELATAFPGNTGIRPKSVAPLAEMLRLNGYSTAMFGKYHETPPWEASVSGPYDRWPTGSGFDKFYGFIGGETNQWSPAVYDGITRVEVPEDPDYHFTTDMTNQAINWVSAQQALTPDKPFYIYFATGATHAPHHAPKEYIEKYKGKFDQGWDKLREETFERQKAMGIIPQDAQLTERPEEIPAWDSHTEEEKRLLARQMEVFAGFAEHTDHEVGRLVDAIEEIGELDNTLIFYVIGDNGSSAEGGPLGSYNEMMALNGIISEADQMMGHIDDWGGPSTFPHFSIGWAHATNTPFQWTKQVASHFGGTRNGMVVHWPNGIESKGGVRSQFTHVTDVAPTVMEAAGLPFPKYVNGVEQTPFAGTSFVFSFNDADAPERHTTQYFEMFGNRGIYHEGWTASTQHSIPWLLTDVPPLEDDVWELYHVDQDFTQANDLADSNPEKLEELQEIFTKEAVKYHVYPIDDRRSERFNAEIAGRPDLMGDRTSLTLYEGMTGIMENVFINNKGRSYTIVADLELEDSGAEGVIISQAGRFGGWSLYMKDGRVYHDYNYFGLEHTNIGATGAMGPGKHQVKYEFIIDEPKPMSGGKCILYVDNEKVAEGRIPKTQPYAYSADEGVDVGTDNETNVTDDYKKGDNAFTGKIEKVVVDIGMN
jgi:arylsulfatase